MTERLLIGQKAPDIVLSDVTGNEIQLARYWPNGPTLVHFLRHYG